MNFRKTQNPYTVNDFSLTLSKIPSFLCAHIFAVFTDTFSMKPEFLSKIKLWLFFRLILQFGLRLFVCAYMCSYVQMHVYICVHICMWRPEVNLRWCFSGAVHLFLRQSLSLNLVLNDQSRMDGQWPSGIEMSFLTSKPPQCVFVCMCDIQVYMWGIVKGTVSRLDSL